MHCGQDAELCAALALAGRPTALFVLLKCGILSFYSGGFATVPIVGSWSVSVLLVYGVVQTVLTAAKLFTG
ncbi:hypothetical protein [Micromonospora sp. WMMD708]|uniref:hypothetical protein n=1 Tax=Micromonospora sp. WMMD708 TaxID=3403464 RepID=UPI003BF5A6DA